MGVKIKGFDKIKKALKRSLTKIPIIAVNEYKKEIVKNLQPSKKSGALSKSWIVKKQPFRAIISSNLPYAAIQNYGGRIKITKKMEKKMWALYKEFGLPVYKAIALKAKTSDPFIRIPAKNYIDINNKALMKKVDVKYNKITKKI